MDEVCIAALKGQIRKYDLNMSNIINLLANPALPDGSVISYLGILESFRNLKERDIKKIRKLGGSYDDGSFMVIFPKEGIIVCDEARA
jgi:hypothetical protein